MPKLVDYTDRIEGIREAAYLITLREGVGAINLSAVAAELHLSVRTLHRLLSSADALPHLGLQWAEKLERYRLLRRPKPRGVSSSSDRALDALLDTLPGRPDHEDRQVWWALVTAFEATSPWAQRARTEQARAVASLCQAVVAEVPAGDRAYEARRLQLLADGATSQVLRGDATYEEAAAMITRHVQLLGGSGDAAQQAAAVGPAPNAA